MEHYRFARNLLQTVGHRLGKLDAKNIVATFCRTRCVYEKCGLVGLSLYVCAYCLRHDSENLMYNTLSMMQQWMKYSNDDRNNIYMHFCPAGAMESQVITPHDVGHVEKANL